MKSQVDSGSVCDNTKFVLRWIGRARHVRTDTIEYIVQKGMKKP
jgi:hypothetical protein